MLEVLSHCCPLCRQIAFGTHRWDTFVPASIRDSFIHLHPILLMGSPGLRPGGHVPTRSARGQREGTMLPWR